MATIFDGIGAWTNWQIALAGKYVVERMQVGDLESLTITMSNGLTIETLSDVGHEDEQ